MLLTLLQFFASRFLVLALHLEAGSFPRPLSPQEEIRAFANLRAGDSSAREKLIRHNLRLVAHIAKKYYALPSEQDDLISIGTIGLMKAVDTFDSTRRARFSTYASRCIENELRMHFRRERKNAPTLSLQETLDAGKEDSALTLADVLQDGFCMEDSCEKQDDAQRLRRLKDALSLLRAEADVFAEDVNAFKQSLLPQRRQNGLADQRNIAVSIALIFRRRGVGGEQRRRQFHAIMIGQLSGDPQHFAFVWQVEAVAGFDLQGGHPFTQQAFQTRLGQRQ